MPSLHQQETAALHDFDTQTLRLPNGRKTEVTATWHTWLAYEELQAFYGWSEEEIFTLFAGALDASDGDAGQAFTAVVAHCYAGCRPEPEELAEAETEPTPRAVYPTLKR